MLSGEGNETGAPNDCFLKYFENAFVAIYKVLLALQKCIKWRYKICISVFGRSWGNLSLFKITRNSELFSRKILDAI